MAGTGQSGRASLAQGRVQTGQNGRAVLEPQQHRCPMCDLTRSCSALGAAKAGAGVVLGSLPLCAEDIAAGRLIRLGEDILEHHESYWAIAGSDAITRSQWDALIAVLVDN